MRFNRNLLAGAIIASGALVAGSAAATHPDLSFPRLFIPVVDGQLAEGVGAQLSFVQQNTFEPNDAATFRTGHTMFLAYYTTVEGENQWLVTAINPIPGVSVYEGVEFVASEGGEFDGSGSLSTEVFDTATVRFNSCSSMSIETANNGTVELATLQGQTACPYIDPVPTTVAEADPICSAGGGVAVDFGSRGIGCAVDASAGPLIGDFTWSNNVLWVISGNVLVGDETEAGASELTIEAGTTVAADSSTISSLVITQASKIDANGSALSPIIMTSTEDVDPAATPEPGAWGGLIVLGRAPINNCSTAPENDVDDNCEAVDEALTQFEYGGPDPHDNSGIIRYVQARYTGISVTQDRELQSFSFFGTGDGTTVEYINSYASSDDGIEFFGGTTDLSRVVSVGADDDGFDWGFGYRGKAQYVLVYRNSDHGIEADNLEGNFDGQRRAQPMLANFTIIGSGDEGVRFRRGTGVNLYNSVITGAADTCFNLDNDETFEAAGSPDDLTGTLTVNNTILFNCGNGNFAASEGDLWSTEAFFNAQEGNSVTDPNLNVYLPRQVLKAQGPLVNDSFFQAVDYIGAFRDENDDWTYPWAFGLPRADRTGQ